jgi:hypothetical protein
MLSLSKCLALALAIAGASAALSSNPAFGQGQPVDTGSHLPVALWFAGAWVLGLAIVYGIMRNRKRSQRERERTDQATKELYRAEDTMRAPSLKELS